MQGEYQLPGCEAQGARAQKASNTGWHPVAAVTNNLMMCEWAVNHSHEGRLGGGLGLPEGPPIQDCACWWSSCAVLPYQA